MSLYAQKPPFSPSYFMLVKIKMEGSDKLTVGDLVHTWGGGERLGQKGCQHFVGKQKEMRS